tara:strand:- start:374 stop:778 length:405 start_codon:yes stop_codon:yes gene_type:complete
MKKNLCFFVATILLAIVTSAQDITIDSVAILDSIKHAGTRVQIRYVPIPKEEPKPNEFFSVQLGAFMAELPSRKFAIAENVYHIVNEERTFVYLSGEFNELNDAVLEKRKLKNKGQKNIYVVKVIDKRKIVIIE